MSHTEFVEEIKTRILFSETNFFYSENRAVYEIMWKNAVQWDRSQTTTWRIRTACWITMATETLEICNSYCVCTATMVVRTPFIVTLYCTACPVQFLW
jgi:hypothetical protein